MQTKTLRNPILKRMAAALGASLWVETSEALVFGRHVTAALLVHWSSATTWWEATYSRLETPEPAPCDECGHPISRGRVNAQIMAPGIGPVWVSLFSLGHDHAGVKNQEAPRSIYLVESIKLATDEMKPHALAESSLLFTSPLAPSSVRDVDGSGVERGSELDSYLTSMGHKLRTQLTSLLGYNEILQEEGFASNTFANNALQRIEQSGQMLLDIVNELEVHLVRERAKRKLAKTLQKVSMTLASTLDLNEVIRKIHESIAQLVDFDQSRLLWVRSDYLEVADGLAGEPVRIEGDLPPFKRVLEELADIHYIADVEHDVAGGASALSEAYSSWLCLPLMGAEGPLALITLASYEVDKYSDLDLDLLKAFAHHAFLALSNAREHTETRKLVETDPLTEALSRRYFFEVAQKKLEGARLSGDALSLMMFDVDHFKQVNDTYGHHVGDIALKHVVDNGQLALRPLDLMGRYGGEEFVVLLPGVGLHGAMAIADRVRRRISLTEVETPDEPFGVTISVGVATLHPEQDTSIEALIERADAALYQAKNSGRDRVMAEEFEGALPGV